MEYKSLLYVLTSNHPIYWFTYPYAYIIFLFQITTYDFVLGFKKIKNTDLRDIFGVPLLLENMMTRNIKKKINKNG